MKKTKLSKVKDGTQFKLETRSRSATWTMQTKRKGMCTVTSKGGSTRILPGTTVCYQNLKNKS